MNFRLRIDSFVEICKSNLYILGLELGLGKLRHHTGGPGIILKTLHLWVKCNMAHIIWVKNPYLDFNPSFMIFMSTA